MDGSATSDTKYFDIGGGASGGGSINVFTVEEPPIMTSISANVNGGTGGRASGGGNGNYRGR